MANNPVLFNAALCGASGGAQERWLLSTSAASYAQFAAAATAFATAVDAAIAVQASVSGAQSQLLQSLCQGVLSTRLPQSVNASDYTAIAQAIAALYAALATTLTPGNIEGFLPRGTGAVFQTFDRWSQNEVWAAYFMTPAEQDDFYNTTRTLDLQPKIQLAIDYALYRNSTGIAAGPKVKIGGGIARIDRPIQAGYGVDLRSLTLEGDGMRFGGNFGNSGVGTAIVATFKDAPAIVVQGGWYTQLKDMQIIGPNQSFVVNLLNAAANMNQLLPANWIDPSFPASASTRFAVNCAIAIDPYSGPQPATHYPAVAYPSFLGAVAQYNKIISSNTLMQNILIQGFVAGIALAPCNNDGNGDYMHMENVQTFYGAWGFVWGNSQARTTSVRNCTYTGMCTVFDNHNFGFAAGNAQLLIESTSFNEIIRIFDMDTQNTGGQAPLVLHCFGESMYSIGTMGGNASFAGAANFFDCEFGFSWWERYGAPIYTYVNGASRAMTSFRQCTFFMNGTFAPFDSWLGLHMFTGGQTETGQVWRFEDCNTTYSADGTQLWQKCAMNATGGLTVSILSTRFESYTWRLNHRYNLDTGADLNQVQYGRLNQGKRDRCLPAYGQRAISSQQGADEGVPLTWRNGGINSVGLPTIAGRNITVVWGGGWTADSAWRLGGDVGDVLEDFSNGTTYIVYTRTGTTISARAQSGYDKDGNLLSPPGNNQSFWSLNTRRYMAGPDKAFYGDLTAGSAVVTNIVDGAGNPSGLSADLTAGDWIYQEQEIDKLFVSDAACKIVSFNDGAHTMTMNGNATISRTHFRLSVFTRAPMPNGTATP